MRCEDCGEKDCCGATMGIEIERLRQKAADLEKALEPFSHPDLCAERGGNVQGPESPVYGRDKAVLLLGHFQKAREMLNGGSDD